MRLNCVSGSVLALGATTLLAASAAFGQCTTTCPVGGIQQNDACGGLNPDPNGGCNFTPVQYQDIGAVAFGSPKNVCGTVGTVLPTGRDLDWYRFSLAVPGKVRVTAKDLDSFGVQATNFTIFIINGDDCDTQITEYATASGACPFVSDEIALPAGNHVVILTVNAFAPDLPACPVTYTALIEVTSNLPVQCGGSESCTEAHASGGCSNLSCCGQVCEFNPDCCATAWDETCVSLAVKLCGLFIYNCPPVAGAPANNCATAAASIACGAEAVGFNTSTATTDGPPTACTSGKDIWYVVQFDQVGGGELQVDLNTPDFDSVIGLYNLGASPIFDPNDLPNLFIGCVDANGNGGEAVVLIDAAEGDYYLIQVSGFDAGQGPQSGTGDISLTCRRSIYDTGNTSAVQFDATNMGNYTNTNLGWSSGNLNAANQQRWAAAAFVVPNPGTGQQWNVTAIHGYGFQAAGFTNAELCFKIWKRFAFTTAPNPANAPNYELVEEGCVPMPVPFDIVGGGANEDFQIDTNFEIGAGDYWLTIYANNPDNSPSNWAWFTNAQGGIGYTPDANPLPGLWRAQLWPTPGFIVYRLPATQLMQNAGLDPFKIYAPGFRLIGLKVGGNCPWDLNGDGQVDGADLGILLGGWGAPYDGGDLGELLASWGPCPAG